MKEPACYDRRASRNSPSDLRNSGTLLRRVRLAVSNVLLLAVAVITILYDAEALMSRRILV